MEMASGQIPRNLLIDEKEKAVVFLDAGLRKSIYE
jgi:hypothetical protein